MNENIFDSLDFSNLHNFLQSVMDNDIELNSLDEELKKKLLLQSIVKAKQNSNNSIVEYLINAENFNSHSLFFLNKRLNLNIDLDHIEEL